MKRRLRQAMSLFLTILILTSTIPIPASAASASFFAGSGGTMSGGGGGGIVPCLKWLAARDTTGAHLPELRVFVKMAEHIDSIGGEKASQLINRTRGYFGKGTTAWPNDDGVKVIPEPDEENAAGASFTWTQPDLSSLVYVGDGAEAGFTYQSGHCI